MKTFVFQIKEKLSSVFVNSSDEWVDINVSPLGWYNAVIVSDQFNGKTTEERRKMLKNFMEKYEIKIGFLSLYTPEEAKLLGLSHEDKQEVRLKSWFDLAYAASNQGLLHVQKEEQRLPRTVVFYSFKGGVGRTTGLVHVAWMLAMRGRKVLAVDLDLEAPGLHLLFGNITPRPKYGIVDYFYERHYAPDEEEKQVNITDIFGEVAIENATGRLFVVPAGEISLEYMAKLDDLRAEALGSSRLWETFLEEIHRQLQPDIVLVDSRTGLNEWGAFSLLRVADDIMIFLYPNEENIKGVQTIVEALRHIDNPPEINLIFSKIPNNQAGKEQVRTAWDKLSPLLTPEVQAHDPDENEIQEDAEPIEPIMIDYSPSIAVADRYPVDNLLAVFAPVANLIDEETEKNQLRSILSGHDRWTVIESLVFGTVDAKDEHNDLGRSFQKTSDFDKFIDDSICIVRGQKGTGKTALYWMVLKYNEKAKSLSKGRLDQVISLSAHGSYRFGPGKEDFRYVAERMGKNGSWEAMWRGYALLRLHMEGQLPSLRRQQLKAMNELLKQVPKGKPNQPWTKTHTDLLLKFAIDPDLSLTVKDAFREINDKFASADKKLWLLYDDLDEDIQEYSDYQNDVLAGLFYLIRAADADKLSRVRFKVFIREDIWDRLNFTNKSHFYGRDVLLKWTRIDFLRLALRQAKQSQAYEDLLNKYAPVQDVDSASEEQLIDALRILWGIRREPNRKSKYVVRWVYERLTDSTGTAFPRSLGILLQAAKECELEYRDKPHIPSPTDRLLRSQSLNEGLIAASKQRSQELRQEYPELEPVFGQLSDMKETCGEEELKFLYQRANVPHIQSFEEFVLKLKNIGLISELHRKDNKPEYRFADLYVHGFGMKRAPRKF